MKEEEFGSGMGTAIKYIIAAGFIGFLLNQALFADEMVHKFKSPSFNGQGVSAHYLTIENQETSRKDDAKAAVQAALDELERDAQNTTLARFMKNLESRIYSQLSRDLVDNLFADGIGTEAAGVIELQPSSLDQCLTKSTSLHPIAAPIEYSAPASVKS